MNINSVLALIIILSVSLSGCEDLKNDWPQMTILIEKNSVVIPESKTTDRKNDSHSKSAEVSKELNIVELATSREIMLAIVNKYRAAFDGDDIDTIVNELTKRFEIEADGEEPQIFYLTVKTPNRVLGQAILAEWTKELHDAIEKFNYPDVDLEELKKLKATVDKLTKELQSMSDELKAALASGDKKLEQSLETKMVQAGATLQEARIQLVEKDLTGIEHRSPHHLSFELLVRPDVDAKDSELQDYMRLRKLCPELPTFDH